MKGESPNPLQGKFLECPLWVEFRVELIDQKGWCPLVDLDLPVKVIRQHVEDETCIVHVDVSDDPDTEKVAQMTVECGRRCACNVLTNNGYVPHLLEVGEDGIVIGTHLSDRSEIGDLVSELDEISHRVNLRRLSTQGTGSDMEPVTIDLSSLTEKQQEAATLAVSKGYYETPRETSVEQLADELDITKSALSQRLSSVESKLANAAFDKASS